MANALMAWRRKPQERPSMPIEERPKELLQMLQNRRKFTRASRPGRVRAVGEACHRDLGEFSAQGSS